MVFVNVCGAFYTDTPHPMYKLLSPWHTTSEVIL